MILLDGDHFVIYFQYGYNSSVIDTLICLRGDEAMFTYDQFDKGIYTVNFINRLDITFNKTGLLVSMNASVMDDNDDRAIYTCSVELTNGKAITESGSITSDPYGKPFLLSVPPPPPPPPPPRDTETHMAEQSFIIHNVTNY